MQVKNPILKGFNPDPSIIRVGEDYYIATSTFEWFPGVQIHHSKDLVNWRLLTRPLKRLSQLDMRGNPDSCGVWAPCLSYNNGTFYLVYSNVRSFDGVWKDTPNYLVTTEDISGDWSEPIFLSATGFDGSLFHDEDGRKWFTSMIVDHRKGKFFGGVIIQEYDEAAKKLIGPVHPIFEGTSLGKTEAPHIYKRKGYYYLIIAEGGTEYGHAVSFARSKSITGPYELHPQNPIITANGYENAPLQKCGHADLVESPEGDCYAVFLVGRPLTTLGRCILGRETAIAQMEWREDDWLYLKGEQDYPKLELEIEVKNEVKQSDLSNHSKRYEFNDKVLDIDFQTLRIPIDSSWLSLEERTGYLRLRGRESLTSLHFQSLVARRIKHFDIEVESCLEFKPESFQELAGLVFYYNTCHWIYCHLMGDEAPNQQYLQIIYCDNFDMQDQLEEPISIPYGQPLYLKATLRHGNLQFYYALEVNNWKVVGPELDASILSDDYVRDGSTRYRPAFTGAFVGLCCQDLTGNKRPADFRYLSYTIKTNE